MRDAGWNKRSGERAIRFAIDGYAHFFVQAGQPVGILPVDDRPLQRYVLAVRQVVRNAAPFVARKAAGEGDFGQQPRVGCSVTDLNGNIDALRHSSASGDAVVDSREAVEHRAPQPYGFGNTVFRLFVSVLSRIAVDGRGQQIRFSFALQELHQLDVFLYDRNAGPGLDERAFRPLRF